MTRFQPLLDTLGWAVLHSLWQGALILLLVLVARKLAGPQQPGLAYTAGLAGLGASFAAFLATVFILVGGSEPIDASAATALAAEPTVVPRQTLDVAAASPVSSTVSWREAMPWLGAIWALGFVVLTFQCMYAWAKTRCYATIGLKDPDPVWTDRFAQLLRRAGVSERIRLQVSALVDSPVTLGTFKPLVLVPGGFLSGFPPEQVEAILLHEIAHIRRNDFLIGLVQTAIRTTLYFNPAVRVMSRWVDEDREQACDDFAVCNTGRPLDLAKGLAGLRLSMAPATAMAANDAKSGPLLTRLERLAGRATQTRGLDRVSATAIATALLAATVWGSTSYAHPPEAEEARRILVFKDKMPPIPEMPPMPPMPPAPAIPALPPMNFNPFDAQSTAEFEARMETWGEAMGEWGESYGELMEQSFGEEFEERMEAWGEKMEAWGETLEEQGEAIEHLSDMDDDELAALGLTRSDVEIAAESFGLHVAEGVVGGILPGFLSKEATSEIAQERQGLDTDALARVERALRDNDLAGGQNWEDSQVTDPAQKARDEARRLRDEAYARRDEAYAERDRRRAERDARRAERDAERAERRAEQAERMAENAFEAASVSEELLARLKRDGIIDANADSYVFKTSTAWTQVNGKRQPDAVHRAYRDWLVTENMGEHADLGIEVDRKRVELEMTEGSNSTRISMTR